MIVYAKPLINPNTMQRCGYIFLEIRPSFLQKLYSGGYADREYLFVTDENGVVISSNDSAAVQGELPDFPSIPIYEGNGEAGHSSVLYGGKQYVAVKVPLSAFHGYLVKFVDKAIVQEKVWKTLRLIALVTLGFCLAAAGTSFFLFRHIVRPIQALSRRMTTTKYGTRAEASPRAEDEIETLTRTYDKLLEAVDSYTQNIIEESRARRSAEFSALQMQINPHFLYNTLSSVRALVEEGRDSEVVSETIAKLIQLLRRTIGDRRELIPLEVEVENLQNYVALQNLRYGGRIHWNVFCPDEGLIKAAVPKLLLQPLVENSVFHAFRDSFSAIDITLYISELDGTLRLEVTDNGRGIDADTLEMLKREEIPGGGDRAEHYTGVGLDNIRSRIRLMYGGAYGIAVSSVVGAGTTVRVTLPRQNPD